MKKLYRVEISMTSEILVAAENENEAFEKTRTRYGSEEMSYWDSSDLGIDIIDKNISDKKNIWKDEWSDIPYGDTRTVKEIWKDIEKINKDKAHKEWLEKYHMTFDFYKEPQNG